MFSYLINIELIDTSISKTVESTTTDAKTDKSTTKDSQIITNAITTKQEQATSKLITLIQSTANEITTISRNPLEQSSSLSTTENVQTEPSLTDSPSHFSTDHFTYPTTKTGETSPNVNPTTSIFFDSTSTSPKHSSTSTYTSSTKIEAITTPETDDENTLLIVLLSSVGAIVAAASIIGFFFILNLKNLPRVVHPSGGKTENIALKKI